METSKNYWRECVGAEERKTAREGKKWGNMSRSRGFRSIGRIQMVLKDGKE